MFREKDVVCGRGFLGTFKLKCSRQPIPGMIFLPALQCLCVLLGSDNIGLLYSLDGRVLGSFATHSKLLAGIVALNTKSNTVVVSATRESSLIVITLASTAAKEPRVQAVGHVK